MPPPPPDTDHTVWVWHEELWSWVETERPPEQELPVVETPMPPPDPTGTWEWHIEKIDGVPTQVWELEPYSPEDLDAIQAERDRLAQRAVVRQVVTDLQAEKDRAQTIIDKTNALITAGDTKDLARSVKRIADACIDLARYAGRV
jgi:hypothetical protein